MNGDGSMSPQSDVTSGLPIASLYGPVGLSDTATPMPIAPVALTVTGA